MIDWDKSNNLIVGCIENTELLGPELWGIWVTKIGG